MRSDEFPARLILKNVLKGRCNMYNHNLGNHPKSIFFDGYLVFAQKILSDPPIR